jgi:hypothetical protein
MPIKVTAAPLQGLTRRQYQVMDLVLSGHPSKNIAVDLGIDTAGANTTRLVRAESTARTSARSAPPASACASRMAARASASLRRCENSARASASAARAITSDSSAGSASLLAAAEASTPSRRIGVARGINHGLEERHPRVFPRPISALSSIDECVDGNLSAKIAIDKGLLIAFEVFERERGTGIPRSEVFEHRELHRVRDGVIVSLANECAIGPRCCGHHVSPTERTSR